MQSLFRPLRAVLAALALFAIINPASAAALSDTAENAVLDAVLRAQALGAPATQHWGLTTDTCTDAGAGTEPAGGAYARVAVTASLANWSGTQGAATTVVDRNGRHVEQQQHHHVAGKYGRLGQFAGGSDVQPARVVLYGSAST